MIRVSFKSLWLFTPAGGYPLSLHAASWDTRARGLQWPVILLGPYSGRFWGCSAQTHGRACVGLSPRGAVTVGAKFLQGSLVLMKPRSLPSALSAPGEAWTVGWQSSACSPPACLPWPRPVEGPSPGVPVSPRLPTSPTRAV